ncbi:hypothetical protein [Alkalihalobacillus deserti]|uniref:hypothetical protein n=1 Tax=Alkalihalobacillus deserti TaxID=2879466 RepID=UPI001D15C01B|nr:hypothetical protein [Alkalihalobacillus deserti]
MYRNFIMCLILLGLALSGCQSGPYLFVGESENWNVELRSGENEYDFVEIVLKYKSSNLFPNDIISYVIEGENMNIDMEEDGLNEDGTLRVGIFDVTPEFRLNKAERLASAVHWENKTEEIILIKQ